ncbi:MAG: hypothetical protein A2099_03905 [Planctomycetes bacterium GWF2_39_10]|nr:MAG: hypothetical protein A2099_03905 [Planctomycetes bacterium GWF2_39_10]
MPDKEKSNDARIDAVLTRWQITSEQERLTKKADILGWLENFEPSEREDMYVILEKIEVISYAKIRDWIGNLSRELKKIFKDDFSSVRIFPLGDSPSASGANFLYDFREELRISKKCFPFKYFTEIDLTGIKALVFVDDIIGSGDQATRFARKSLPKIPQNINKYYVVLLALKNGLNKVIKEASFTQVIPAKVLSEEYKAFSPKSCYFKNTKQRERLKEICYKYGKLLYRDHPLGYEDSQGLFVFPHNVPNNTLPIIWAGPESESKPGVLWKPLWKRVKIPTQPPKEPSGKPPSEPITKRETNEKSQEMQQHLDIKDSPGTIVILQKGDGDININANLPSKKKKPLRELYDKLAESFDKELKESLE